MRDAAFATLLLSLALGCNASLGAPRSSPRRDAGVDDAGPLSGDAGQAADAGPTAAPVAPPSPARCPADLATRFAAYTARLEAALGTSGVPGAAFAVVCGDEVFTAAVGSRQRGGTAPVTVDTRFQLASTTKMFTGILGLVLAEAGTVDLRAPISAYVPGLAYGHVTLEQLLAHTAGFPTGFDAWDADLATVVESNGAMVLWSTPGAVHNYSNPGFSVAGHVMARAAGASFEQLVQTHILEPVGLDATLDTAVVRAGDFAYGHTDRAPYAPHPIGPDDAYFHTSYYHPMGGLWGSARDLARWMSVHLAQGDGVLSPSVIEQARQPSVVSYAGRGYGWGHYVETYMSPRLVHHGGSSPGFVTILEMVPEAGVGAALVVNGDTLEDDIVGDLLRELVDFEYGGAATPEPPGTWADYVGAFHDPVIFGDVTVAQRSGQLFLTYGDGEQTQLSHAYGETYDATFEGEPIDVEFWRNSEGRVTHVVSAWGVAERVD